MRHADAGLNIKYVTDCVDHQVHLLVEESLRVNDGMKQAVENGHSVVVHFSKAALSRQALKSIQEELGLQVLCPMIGTQNRWYFKKTSTERLLQIRTPVEVFLERQDVAFESYISDKDWELMEEYVKLVQPFEIISKFFGGENYPAATSVIPALDQIRHDLSNAVTTTPEGHAFMQSLITNFDKRFVNCWKEKVPFNCLTFLDPRYIDLYVDNEDAMDKIKNDIRDDVVYNKLVAEDMTRASLQEGGTSTVAVPVLDEVVDEIVPSSSPSTSVMSGTQQSQAESSSRRASLLAKKRSSVPQLQRSKSVLEGEVRLGN